MKLRGFAAQCAIALATSGALWSGGNATGATISVVLHEGSVDLCDTIKAKA